MRHLNQFFTVTVIAALFPCMICPQTAAPPEKQQNLYADALSASLAEMDKQWGHLGDANSGRARTDYRKMIVEKTEITYDLPDDFGEFHVEYLDWRGLIDRYKMIRKEFAVLEVSPIRTDGPKLRIQVSVSWFSYSRRRSYFAFSDWSDVTFVYDAAKQAYTITSVKLGGI